MSWETATSETPATIDSSDPELMARILVAVSRRDQQMLDEMVKMNKSLKRQNEQMMNLMRELIHKDDTSFHKSRGLLTQPPIDELTISPLKSEQSPRSPRAKSPGTFSSHLKKMACPPQPTLEHRNSLINETFCQQKATQEFVKVNIPSPVPVVHFSEREIVVNIAEIALDYLQNEEPSLKSCKVIISKWIAQMYDHLSRETFQAFYGRHISLSQAKIFFTHNMAINFEQMTRYFWQRHPTIWQNQKHQLLLHFEQETSKNLDFLMVKYPQKKKTYVSEEHRQAIPVFDRSLDPHFDMVRATGCFFKHHKDSKDYYKDIKLFLNRLILESKKHYKQFRSLMKDIFKVDGLQLKNAINMKLKQSTPSFTKDELLQQGLDIKMPEILRIIVKWIEQLERKIQRIADGSILYGTFHRKSNNLEPQYLNKEMISLLGRLTNRQEMLRIGMASMEMKTRIRSLLGLLPEYMSKYEPHFAHLKPNALKSGLLSYILSQTAQNLSIRYLIFLINFCEHLAIELHKEQRKIDSNSKRNEFEFVSFCMADLLRCKCSGNLHQIKTVYEKLSNNPRFIVYRVKNRLDTSNRDFLVNFKFKGTPMLCEMQLAITQQVDDIREMYINQFAHFIYELSRAKYGPIGEAVMINTHLTEFAPFFQRHLMQLYEKTARQTENIVIQSIGQGFLKIKNYSNRDNIFTFVCSSCLEFKKAFENYYAHFDNCDSYLACQVVRGQQQYGKQKMLCVDCIIDCLSSEDRTRYLIGDMLSHFFVEVDITKWIKCLMEDVHTDWKTRFGYICVVRKRAAVRKPEILQIEVINGSPKLIPVFYESSPNKQMMPLSRLSDYYVFQLNALQYQVRTKAAVDIRSMINKQKYEQLFQDDIVDVLKMIGNLMMPEKKEQSQLKSTQNSNRKSSEDLSAHSKRVVYGATYFNDQQLNMLNKQILAVVTNPQTPYLLILSIIYEPDELKRLNTIGRELTQGETNMMMSNGVWNMNERDVGDNSFEIFGGEELNNVKQIRIDRNKLTKIDFISSNTLRELNMAQNGVKHLYLQSSIFPQLNRLILSKNRISRIDTLQHRSLRQLAMRDCGIQRLNVQKWQLPSLTQLDLSCNGIIELDLSNNQLNNLKRLNIQQNGLQYLVLPESMLQLQELNLRDNKLRTIDLGIYDLPAIKTLELRKNVLEAITLPKDMPNLYELYIFNNRLRSLNLSRLVVPKLANLHLQENKLEWVDLPRELPEIRWLNLADNKLKEVDLTKIKSQRLKLLNLQRNRIEVLKLPPQLRMLQELVLHTNKIKQFSAEQHELWHLKLLNISGNMLRSFKLQSYLPSLQSLLLNRNYLNKVQLEQSDLPSLQIISLQYNFLEQITFNDSALPVMGKLKQLNAAYNPFKSVIPSNICVQTACIHFPKLEVVAVGLPQLEMFGIWLLLGCSEKQMGEIFEQTEKSIGRHLEIEGIKMCLRVKIKLAERLKYLKDDVVEVVLRMYDTGRIPNVFEAAVKEKLKQLNKI